MSDKALREKVKNYDLYKSTYAEIATFYQLFRAKEEENEGLRNRFQSAMAESDYYDVVLKKFKFLFPGYYRAKNKMLKLQDEYKSFYLDNMLVLQIIEAYTSNFRRLDIFINRLNKNSNYYKAKIENKALIVGLKNKSLNEPLFEEEFKITKVSNALRKSFAENNIKIDPDIKHFLKYLEYDINKHNCHFDSMQLMTIMNSPNTMLATAYTKTFCDEDVVYHTWIETNKDAGEELCIDANLNAFIPKKLYYMLKQPQLSNLNYITYGELIEDLNDGFFKSMGGNNIKQYVAFRKELKEDFMKNKFLYKSISEEKEF
ncbi:MAG: hypothetical protein IJT25_00750 [Clostridia bacterium]|nr:hypothetical protein [Clostridia bacterium]